MAQYPCDHCGQHYFGAGSRAFITILNGADRWEHKPRLCPVHLRELQERFLAVNGLVDREDPRAPAVLHCLVCAQPVAGRVPHSVFMISYAGRAEREDWFAAVCRDHRPQAEVLLRGGKEPA